MGAPVTSCNLFLFTYCLPCSALCMLTAGYLMGVPATSCNLITLCDSFSLLRFCN